jgi:pyruvate ferredoxin oxidoreductase alpha subunit
MSEIKYPNQVLDFLNGNEMAAMAASHINFHLMGYFPITPSTQVAETLDAMKSQGLHQIRMVPADGEHGAAGICYGASTAGGRVLNVTSANGLLYAIEQLPVQSGTRYPMVLNVVNRSVSGPLDIKCDHSDIMMVLNAGWIIMMVRNPQMIYDFNIIAVKIGELPEVRLPVIISYDGFFTSHQKRRVFYFKDPKIVQDFLGPHIPVNSSIDPENPITIGAYMNEPDLINNKMQLNIAMENAYRLFPKVFEEYAKISGRMYGLIDTYKLEDAEAGMFILNSAYGTARLAVDKMREQGYKVGLITANVIRPFPREEIQSALRHLKALVVMDRQDSYGSYGGNMTHEIKSALKDDPENKTTVITRIYGIGGKELYVEEAVNLLKEVYEVAQTGKVSKVFDYFGAYPGDPNYVEEPVMKPISKEASSPGLLKIERDEKGIIRKVKGVNIRALTSMLKRVAPGHGACPGCGIFVNVNLLLKGIEGYVVVLYHTGCAEVVSSGYPYTSHNVTFIHNLFQNGAATMSGIVEMFEEKKKRGKIPEDLEITFVMLTGDGGNDIGMGPTIGAAIRGHRFIILEYDNEGYMNTGAQLSYSTPKGHRTSTSNVGPYQQGKTFHHKDTPQIMAATNIPYVFTAAESHPADFIKKAHKAYHYAKEGLVYGKVLSYCPLNWLAPDNKGRENIEMAVNTCFFPLYEVDHGITTITYDPEKLGKKKPISEWFKMMGKTKHLLKPENKELLEEIQKEIDIRWKRLKAKSEHPLL